MQYGRQFVIAEAGCNHMGQMEIAHDMIETAAHFCKVDAIKFQKRCPKELLTSEQYNAPHPNPLNSYGKTYGEHREFLEFSIDQHSQLKKWCEDAGVIYSTSVWDLTSAKEVVELNPKFIKIPSACNTHFTMLKYICDNYKGKIHLSLGMTTHEEERKIIEFFNEQHRLSDVVIYNCTSGYPVPFEDVCLLEINRLSNEYANMVSAIGFSGHHNGIAVDIAAYTLGATYFERHFTLNRTWKGTDHAASLEPDGMRRLARDLRNVRETLTYKSQEVLPIEQVQRDKLKYKQR